MKHRIIVPSFEGDTALAEWEVGDAEAEAFAKEIYEQAKADGWGVVANSPEGGIAVEEFSPSVDEYLLLRPIAGG